jgi:hypothetical protein
MPAADEADFREIAIVLRIEATRAKRDLELLEEFFDGLKAPAPGTRDAYRRLQHDHRMLVEAARLFVELIPHEATVRELSALT